MRVHVCANMLVVVDEQASFGKSVMQMHDVQNSLRSYENRENV